MEMGTLIAAQKNGVALKNFMSRNQLDYMLACVSGEEGEHFADKLAEMANVTDSMAKTYEQDGKGDEAIVYLHYFYGNFDWYITEKDMDDSEGQIQAFGYADMGFPELGYICIRELIENGVELDLYWKPRTLAEVKRERGE